MKEYLINITVCVIVTTIIDKLNTNAWAKYIKVITGLILLITLLVPIKRIEIPSFDNFFSDAQNYTLEGENLTNETVFEELKNRIENDIEMRLKDEFNIDTKVSVDLIINQDKEISGVKEINISKKEVPKKVIERLKEIYAPKVINYG